MKKILSGYLIGTLFLIGCSANEEQSPSSNQDASNNSEDPQQEELSLSIEGLEVMVENLDVPCSIEKSDSTFYLTERTGTIVKIEGEEVERQRVELEEEVPTASEAGLLGVFVMGRPSLFHNLVIQNTLLIT